jgi:CNT family concentrative nucleoside transporter
MTILRAGLGVVFFCLLAWLLSSERRRFPWRVVGWGLGLQVALAFLVLRTEAGFSVLDGLSAGVQKLTALAQGGASMVFGVLADKARMESVFGQGQGFVFAFAGQGLIVIIFFSALFSVLYHVGVMQAVVWGMARLMSVTLGVSGAEAMSNASNVLLGQTEAPLVVKPYIERMTQSELSALMTGGFATIAGSVMAVYIGMLGPEYGPHLIAGSVMAAPAAFVMSKIMRPETEVSQTAGRVPFRVDRAADNVIEAAANGTTDGLKLWLNVIAMLIAFVALVAFVNWPLGALGSALDVPGGLSLERFFGWVFAPVAWLVGVDGWGDCTNWGTLLGTKISLNEFVAYSQLAQMQPGDAGLAQSAGPPLVFAAERSARMAAYALCGFANFASIGIQIGGISALAPGRKADLSRLAFRAMLGGAFATCMTATIAGMFL